MTDDILVQTSEGIGTIALNRPDRKNALTRRQLADLPAVLRALDDEGVRAALLVGAGSWFSSGMDLDELTGTEEDKAVDDALGAIEAAVDEVSFPLVAAVEGGCIGAGFDVATACDHVVAGSSAVLSVPSARFAILYRPAMLQRLVARGAYQLAFRLVVLSEVLRASDPAASAAVQVVPDGEAAATARRALEAAIRADKRAVHESKRLFRQLLHGGFDDERWASVAQELSASPERLQAVRDVHDRRRPTSP